MLGPVNTNLTGFPLTKFVGGSQCFYHLKIAGIKGSAHTKLLWGNPILNDQVDRVFLARDDDRALLRLPVTRLRRRAAA